MTSVRSTRASDLRAKHIANQKARNGPPEFKYFKPKASNDFGFVGRDSLEEFNAQLDQKLAFLERMKGLPAKVVVTNWLKQVIFKANQYKPGEVLQEATKVLREFDCPLEEDYTPAAPSHGFFYLHDGKDCGVAQKTFEVSASHDPVQAFEDKYKAYLRQYQDARDDVSKIAMGARIEAWLNKIKAEAINFENDEVFTKAGERQKEFCTTACTSEFERRDVHSKASSKEYAKTLYERRGVDAPGDLYIKPVLEPHLAEAFDAIGSDYNQTGKLGSSSSPDIAEVIKSIGTPSPVVCVSAGLVDSDTDSGGSDSCDSPDDVSDPLKVYEDRASRLELELELLELEMQQAGLMGDATHTA